MIQTKREKSGFALLMTLLLLGVVIGVTLSIVELTLRQVRLTIDGRDAEIAFQAASAGVECAQRIARNADSAVVAGGDLDFDCFETNVGAATNISGLNSDDNNSLRRYRSEIDWNNRCTEIDLIAVITDEDDVTISNIQSQIFNYPDSSWQCFAGSTCFVVATAGYNVPCADKDNLGVLKREMLLEF